MEKIKRDERGIIVGIILFTLAIAIKFIGNGHLSGIVLIIVGIASMVFSKQIAVVINRHYSTTYSGRFPILWGIGIMIGGLAWFFDLP